MDQPAALAHDKDRDAALDVLHEAVADGRLSAAEHDDRVSKALVARTTGELADLVADVRPAPSPQRESVTAVLSNSSRKGHWRVPEQVRVRAVLGDCRLDLSSAVLTAAVTTISLHATLGHVTVLVPSGVDVRVTGRAFLATRRIQANDRPPQGAPVIVIDARAYLGTVTVRPVRMTEKLRKWLRS